MEKSIITSFLPTLLTLLTPPLSSRRLSKKAPNRRRQKVAGSWLGNTDAKRSSKTRRLKPVEGCCAAATSSRQNPGFSPPPSSSRLAIRKSGSPKKDPAIPLAIWSLKEGSVVSPPVSHRKLPTKV